MFLGMDLPGLNLPSPQKTYAMMGFVVWHIGTEVLLEIHAYRLSRKGNLLEKPYCELEGWCRVHACHASIRIWVQISSSHTKRRAWSCVSVTLVLFRNGDRRMTGIFWLPALLQVQWEMLTEGNKAESLHVCLHIARVQTHACTYMYVHAYTTPPRYRKFATFSSLKCRKLGCVRIQIFILLLWQLVDLHITVVLDSGNIGRW